MDWSGVTICECLRVAAQNAPHKLAVVDPYERVSFAELNRRVEKFAACLTSLGVNRGDHVALWMTNCTTWLVTWYACARIGAVLIPINTRYKVEETRYILKQSDSRILVMMDHYWDIDYTAMVEEMLPGLSSMNAKSLTSDEFPELSAIIRWGREEKPGFLSMDCLMDGAMNSVIGTYTVEAKDPSIVVYTSGTTGAPKGAVHSHIVLKNANNIARALHIESDDIILGHMPFYHVAGAFAAALTALLRECTLIAVPHWKPVEVLELINQEQVSIMAGIPTHYIDLVDAVRQGGRRPLTLKTGWIGGAAVTPDVAATALQELNMKSLQVVYGMTETTSTTTLSRFEDPIDVVCDNRGVPVGDFDVAVFSDRDEPLPSGEVGEVRVRGHVVMMSYYKNPEATTKVITPDGWFKTGDMGFFDERGYLKITGRKSEMFIVGGSNTYPAEIEKALQAHEGIKQAVVVGVPDRRLGEVGYAFVHCEKGSRVSESQLNEYCRSLMADYKVPRYFEFVDEFCKTTTGKIQRSELAMRAKAVIKQDQETDPA